jgi:regulator of cell morphogenesis and NO signaling
LLKNNNMNSQEFYSKWHSIYSDKGRNVENLEAVNQYSEFDKEDIISSMENFSVVELLNFLKVSHQYYLSKTLPEIEQSLLHITGRYSEVQNMLTSLAYFFNSYKNKLVKHIRKEDVILFPFIDNLVLAKKGEFSEVEVARLLDRNVLNNFEEHHDAIEEELGEVIKVLLNLSSTKNLPMPFRVFLNQISFFELELRKHAIIEDEVLLPKVKELEMSLRNPK